MKQILHPKPKAERWLQGVEGLSPLYQGPGPKAAPFLGTSGPGIWVERLKHKAGQRPKESEVVLSGRKKWQPLAGMFTY